MSCTRVPETMRIDVFSRCRGAVSVVSDGTVHSFSDYYLAKPVTGRTRCIREASERSQLTVAGEMAAVAEEVSMLAPHANDSERRSGSRRKQKTADVGEIVFTRDGRRL